MVKRINALRPGIERLTGQLLDEMTAKESSADLVEQFALSLSQLLT